MLKKKYLMSEHKDLRRIACTFLSLLLLSGLYTSPSQAGEQADRAIQQVKSLVSSGDIPSGAVLRLVAKQGNIANFLGKDHALRLRWEHATGTVIDVNTMPQMASLSFVRKYDNVDLTIARNREFADLYQQGLVEDLSPYAERFGINIRADDDLFLQKLQSEFAGKQIAIPADGDIALLYVRKDLIENPENQALYQQRFRQPLETPNTWQEYLRQVEFFHQPNKGIYGSLEQRDRASGWMFWMLRYAAQSRPNQFLFDEDMNPLVDSPQGIAATENYIATVKFSPEGILNKENNYTFTLPRFLNGQGYSTIITLAGAKTFNLSHSKVKGKYLVIPMPGVQVGNKLNRRTTLIYGNNLIIPKTAKNKELAYLYAMWLTDPDTSVEAISTRMGFSDPYRYSHLSTDVLKEIYAEETLNTVREQLSYTVPAGTGLPGDEEYISALNEQIYLAAGGQKTASQAMKDTASAWQKITDKQGRENQKKLWAEVRKMYPEYNGSK